MKSMHKKLKTKLNEYALGSCLKYKKAQQLFCFEKKVNKGPFKTHFSKSNKNHKLFRILSKRNILNNNTGIALKI